MRRLEPLARRVPLGGLAFAVAAMVAVAVILYWGRSLTFWQDAWVFILDKLPWNLDSFMVPHNEHWALGIAVIWKPLLEIVGMDEYWPYLLVLALLHVATAAAIYRFFVKQVNVVAALAASVAFLFLGTAGEDLFWAFQTGFVGAAAAGTWALVLFLEPETRLRSTLSALLLLVAVAMSGPGLFFVAAVAAVVVIVPTRRARFWVLLPAVIVYATWLLLYGRNTLGHDYVEAIRQFDQVVGWVRVGVETAVGHLTGLGPEVGLVLGVILVGALAWNLVSGGAIVEGALAGTAGLISQFVIVGLGRALEMPENFAGSSRYVYAAAVFVLIAAGAWLGSRRLSTSMTIAFVAVLAGLTIVSLATNLPAVKGWRDFFIERAHETRAAVGIMVEYADSPGVRADAAMAPTANQFLRGLPGPERLDALADRVGLDLADYSATGPPIPDEIYDRVLFGLTKDAFIVSTAPSLPAVTSPLDVTASADVSTVASGDCITLSATGPDPQVTFAAPGGATLHALMPRDASAQVFLAFRGAHTNEASATIGSASPDVTIVGLPDLDEDTPWSVRFDPPSVGSTIVCVSIEDVATSSG